MPTLREASRVWTYVGLNSFGGPAGQIAVMHREVVDERGWLSERRFLHALNFCMLLPGPEAQQLATYIGWLLNGIRGGLVAGLLFIVPGAVFMLGLSVVYAVYGQVSWVAGLLFGLQAAVVAIVVQALVRVGRRTLHSARLVLLALASFVALFFFAVPFPVVIIVAGLLGWVLGRGTAGTWEADDDDKVPQPAARRALLAAGVCLVLWLGLVGLLLAGLGGNHILTQIAVLFSKTAVLSFGGAYAALTYVAQEAVATYGWISTAEMTTGLGLAETTPGPLILVLQFVGFLAAFQAPGTLPPLVAGLIGAGIAMWVIFLPCFMFIFAGAPYVDALRHNRGLHEALTAVSAAVVGVIANLAVWFAAHTFFDTRTVAAGPLTMTLPILNTVDWVAVALAVLAGLLVVRNWPTWRVLALVAVIGGLITIWG